MLQQVCKWYNKVQECYNKFVNGTIKYRNVTITVYKWYNKVQECYKFVNGTIKYKNVTSL